jgi:biotin synthase
MATSGTGISSDEANHLMSATSGPELAALLDRATRCRAAGSGDRVGLCAIVNARAGGCSEDCAFCAQSARVRGRPGMAGPMMSASEIAFAATRAEASSASSFSIVTAGRRLTGQPALRTVAEALGVMAGASGLRRCASLGLLDQFALRQLRAAGLERYHHNLEAARSFYRRVCTTHGYDENVATIRAAREVGLSVCSGGIFGVGETPEQRVELAAELRSLGVDAVPINFLDPRPGTPLEAMPPLSAGACLATIAVFRLMLPQVELIVMGGRERQLGEAQRQIFAAGASGTLIGDYLTTAGSAPGDVLAMIHAAGLRPVAAPFVREGTGP